MHIEDKKKDISILSKDSTDGLDDTMLTAEKEYSINYIEQQKNSYIFVNGFEIYKFKAKDFEINVTPLCLCNVPKYFSVGDDSIDDHDILDLHKYLMRKHDIK